ncbi:hypothetical protein PR048_009561 [Dryococelus australis]|uniref:Mos1 transposase HTH domain-containing protein n=1 Tax=Dryococelus australis TaxID=614101 RepID=A0ABQ9I0A2_9NEOP|nr:hypothetical protein PR048_009561 [Dryococelus australis]
MKTYINLSLHGHPDALMNPWKIPDCFATCRNTVTEGARLPLGLHTQVHSNVSSNKILVDSNQGCSGAGIVLPIAAAMAFHNSRKGIPREKHTRNSGLHSIPSFAYILDHIVPSVMERRECSSPQSPGEVGSASLMDHTHESVQRGRYSPRQPPTGAGNARLIHSSLAHFYFALLANPVVYISLHCTASFVSPNRRDTTALQRGHSSHNRNCNNSLRKCEVQKSLPRVAIEDEYAKKRADIGVVFLIRPSPREDRRDGISRFPSKQHRSPGCMNKPQKGNFQPIQVISEAQFSRADQWQPYWFCRHRVSQNDTRDPGSEPGPSLLAHISNWLSPDHRILNNTQVKHESYIANSSHTGQQNGVTGQQNAGTLFDNQVLVTYYPADRPANRRTFRSIRESSDQQKAYCVLHLAKTGSITVAQRHLHASFGNNPPSRRNICRWYIQFEETGPVCKKNITGQPRVNNETVDSIRKLLVGSLQKIYASCKLSTAVVPEKRLACYS